MANNDTVDPITEDKRLPVAALGYGRGRKTVRWYDVEEFAIRFFDSSKRGIKVSHIEAEFRVNKEHARRIVKRLRNGGRLFTPENTKPQRYYPTVRRPHVIEYLDNKRRLLVEATGTRNTSSKHALFNALENQKADNFLETLLLLPLCPRHIHNLHMKTKIDNGVLR